MLRPFHVIAEGTVLDSDICIIGTGPAGLTVARALERTGLRIVMIEAGSAQVKPATQDDYAGEVVDLVHPPSQMYRGSAALVDRAAFGVVAARRWMSLIPSSATMCR